MVKEIANRYICIRYSCFHYMAGMSSRGELFGLSQLQGRPGYVGALRHMIIIA